MSGSRPDQVGLGLCVCDSRGTVLTVSETMATVVEKRDSYYSAVMTAAAAAGTAPAADWVSEESIVLLLLYCLMIFFSFSLWEKMSENGHRG